MQLTIKRISSLNLFDKERNMQDEVVKVMNYKEYILIITKYGEVYQVHSGKVEYDK